MTQSKTTSVAYAASSLVVSIWIAHMDVSSGTLYYFCTFIYFDVLLLVNASLFNVSVCQLPACLEF